MTEYKSIFFCRIPRSALASTQHSAHSTQHTAVTSEAKFSTATNGSLDWLVHEKKPRTNEGPGLGVRAE